jgi:hypothetical protein
MQIPTRSALLAAQTIAGAQPAQTARHANAPRRINASDLSDLAPKTEMPNRTTAALDLRTPASASAANATARGEQRLMRPGSTLDIKV